MNVVTNERTASQHAQSDVKPNVLRSVFEFKAAVVEYGV